MRKIIYIVVCLLCLTCSNSQEPEKPKNLILEDKMVSILVDLSILSSAKGVNKKAIERNGITPHEYVYKRHEIDSMQFVESNAYYSFYIDDYNLILNRVQDSLEQLKFKYNRLAEKDEKKDEDKKGDKKIDLRKTKNIDSLITSSSDNN